MIILVIIRSLVTPYARASQYVQKLFEVTLLLYCRREKTIKGGNFLWRMKPKKLFSGFAISHALWTIFLLFKSRTSSALQFYSESQGRANGRNCNWRLQFGKNMSKCKYTYMYFPLYKQVVLSDETVFNEGEGDTDPQALHHGIHLLRSLPRTIKITYFCLPLFCSIKSCLFDTKYPTINVDFVQCLKNDIS